MLSGQADTVSGVHVAKVSFGIQFTGEGSEVLYAGVQRSDLTGVRGEDFGPVWAGFVGSTLCLMRFSISPRRQ